MIRVKYFYNDKFINTSIKWKSSKDHLNEFIIEKKLDKSDIINVMLVKEEDGEGHPQWELVLFYWDKEMKEND